MEYSKIQKVFDGQKPTMRQKGTISKRTRARVEQEKRGVAGEDQRTLDRRNRPMAIMDIDWRTFRSVGRRKP